MKSSLSIIIAILNFLLFDNVSKAESFYKLQNYQKQNLKIYAHVFDNQFKGLGNDDILIIFSSVVDRQKQIVYVAEIHRKGNKKAKEYNLFCEKQLLDCVDIQKCFYNNIRVTELIWKPIEEELQETKNIYYVPCGLLTNISLEYCMDINGKRFAENHNIYRLSSPSVLGERARKKNTDKISIWGGINFDADLSRLTEYAYADTMSVSKCNIGDLEDSYRAAVLINEEIWQQGIYSEFYADNEATEERFKSQIWNNIDVLFIETHGLFLSDYNLSSVKDKKDPMENHALALAGASYALEGGDSSR